MAFVAGNNYPNRIKHTAFGFVDYGWGYAIEV
jgi:hypothetical protein